MTQTFNHFLLWGGAIAAEETNGPQNMSAAGLKECRWIYRRLAVEGFLRFAIAPIKTIEIGLGIAPEILDGLDEDFRDAGIMSGRFFSFYETGKPQPCFMCLVVPKDNDLTFDEANQTADKGAATIGTLLGLSKVLSDNAPHPNDVIEVYKRLWDARPCVICADMEKTPYEVALQIEALAIHFGAVLLGEAR